MLARGASAGEDYFFRPKYPTVRYISTEDLNNEYDKVVIVDVRSNVEFMAIHINKAILIPLANDSFDREVKELREKHQAQPIVFYCNGHLCEKSYEACERAASLGIKNILAYDSGIHDWVERYPDKTTLIGKTPADRSKMIPTSELQQHKLKWVEFAKKAYDRNTVIIDIREPMQRKDIIDLPGLKNIPSDKLIPLLKRNEFKGKTLLITDAVGKQVEWLQYFFEEYGYKKYYFLEFGVLSAKEANATK